MDPLSNRVTLIQNAQRANRSRVTFSSRTGCNSSHAVFSLLRVLRNEGFIEGIEKITTKQSQDSSLRVYLKYGSQGEPAIRRIFRVSTTGRRIYASAVTLWQPQTTVGLLILSTSQGIITDREARQRGLGGEIILGVRLIFLKIPITNYVSENLIDIDGIYSSITCNYTFSGSVNSAKKRTTRSNYTIYRFTTFPSR